jgi:hypothetical protein
MGQMSGGGDDEIDWKNDPLCSTFVRVHVRCVQLETRIFF